MFLTLPTGGTKADRVLSPPPRRRRKPDIRSRALRVFRLAGHKEQRISPKMCRRSSSKSILTYWSGLSMLDVQARAILFVKEKEEEEV